MTPACGLEGCHPIQLSLMQVSFVELHRNQIRDLLTEEDNCVRLRECPVNGPYIENVTCGPSLAPNKLSCQYTRSALPISPHVQQ